MQGTTDFEVLRRLLQTGTPPGLGPGPRPGCLGIEEVDRAISGMPAQADLPAAVRGLVRGVLLLWNDHLDEAHVIAQAVEDADGSFLHGIIHRREPDYANAGYWFRRTGAHPAFPEIAAQVAVLLAANQGASVAASLIPRGRWDPFVFIDHCAWTKGRRKPTLRSNCSGRFKPSNPGCSWITC